jgi:hypothetical protein
MEDFAELAINHPDNHSVTSDSLSEEFLAERSRSGHRECPSEHESRSLAYDDTLTMIRLRRYAFSENLLRLKQIQLHQGTKDGNDDD